MKASILLAFFLSSCAANQTKPYQRTQPKLDAEINAVNIGGFRLQMTARAALAIIKAKGYRESSSNLETLEDISLSRGHYAAIKVYEFPYGETLDDQLSREMGIFDLEFEHGRMDEISYHLYNITKEKLQTIRERNEEPFHFAAQRETAMLGPRNGTVTSWTFRPNELAVFRVNYVQREPLFATPQLQDPGVGRCEYSIVVHDGNPNLLRLQ